NRVDRIPVWRVSEAGGQAVHGDHWSVAHPLSNVTHFARAFFAIRRFSRAARSSARRRSITFFGTRNRRRVKSSKRRNASPASRLSSFSFGIASPVGRDRLGRERECDSLRLGAHGFGRLLERRLAAP